MSHEKHAKTFIKRSISPLIQEYLDEKIILLSGPRQVGKTFLSKSLKPKYQYFNFDLNEHRLILESKTWVRDGGLLIFDEIQKMKKWKQWIKGVWDTEKGSNQFLLTGSSRLDTMRKAGESLAGRHISARLNPFSIKEINGEVHSKTILEMIKLGTFPEPLLSGSERKAALWRKSHLDMILRQDLISLEQIKDIVSLELLVESLRTRVGQQISYKKIADELSVSPHTIKKWIQILESLFVIFVVHPFVKKVSEAVKKEPKIYFYDVGQVLSDDGFKLENLVALHLLKRNQFLEDTEGKKLRLCYIRDKKKRKVDFAIEEGSKLTHLIEVKTSEDDYNVNLNYFSQRLKPEIALHLVLNLKQEKDFESYKLRSLAPFLAKLET
jgi:predicted AAA+ superfamily ATPase